MPKKITTLTSGLSPKERLDAFRQKIRPGEGYTAEELSELPEIGMCAVAIRQTWQRHGWAVKQWDMEKHRSIYYLVHPKTLELCRKKSKRKT